MPDLTASHRTALDWFEQRTGQVIAWPAPLPDGGLLVNRAKGIHKPAGSAYALSVRQVLNGPYDDLEPEILPGGGWRYRYFQEGADLADRDRRYTNRGLLACQADGVPVGVLIQRSLTPKVTYEVLGLAYVRGWENGYFTLESVDAVTSGIATPQIVVAPFDPTSVEDGRRRIQADIVARQGQGRFRRHVLAAYKARCAITGCDVEAALEAAHISPYRGAQTNAVQNGLLLRADLHTLFDLGLLAIDEASMKVVLHPSLVTSSYGDFAGKPVRMPEAAGAGPSREALAAHRAAAGL
jgi:putative restriction endonuclease